MTHFSRGPRSGRGEMREQLLIAARELFSAQEFPSVTVRAIAKRAGCDPGLVSYYFASKAGIFRAAMSLPQNPVEVISAAFGDGRRGTGERVLLAVMNLWEHAAAGSYFSVFASTLLSSPAALQMFRSWIDSNLAAPLVERIGGKDARIRFDLAFSQVLGVIATRYVYGMRPLADIPKEQLAHRYGSHIDAVLATN